METIVKWVDVGVPRHTAYNQWTQFEQFPRFMEGIESVTQLSEDRLHWVANIGGVRREWFSRITEQIPDERVAWTSEAGPFNAGCVTFHTLSPVKTRVTLQLEYQPEGFVEHAGAALGAVSARIQGDLDRFRAFLEARGQETGAWRGVIRQET
jgi:uncharacterized membrane protein